MVSESNPGWAERLASHIRQELPECMENAMETTVEAEAKRQVYLGHPDHLNRQTGNLSRATTTEVSQSGDSISASVGNNLVYFPTHEFGAAITDDYGTTRIIPPRPFLNPAWQDQKGNAVDKIKSGVSEMVRSECR